MVKVTVNGDEVTPCCVEANPRVATDSDQSAIPVPFKVTVEEPTVIEPLSTPVTEGVKFTVSVHVPDAATLEAQPETL